MNPAEPKRQRTSVVKGYNPGTYRDSDGLRMTGKSRVGSIGNKFYGTETPRETTGKLDLIHTKSKRKSHYRRKRNISFDEQY